YTELGLISHLAANQNARIGIRQVIRSSAGALLALKPCFIMSPLAVSRYLPPESIRFDLVIMDEASQLRPEDALGAVARGGQLVVVGDPLQLPPPSFFEPTISAPEDEATDSAATALLVDQPAGRGELENMLEIASSRYQPVCQLKWHYRSRHQSLINFANREFYQDRLTVFPSPETNPDRSGLKLCYIEDGVWEQNCNRPEAAAVVAAAIDHLTNYPTESLGIVALNLRQRELIVELLERALCDNRVAAEHYQNMQEGGEELFVKNLEIVQGDEREVIFVSGTVGRDILGRFRLTSLGPLTNNRYGHRRLNVLITRARSRLVYFTSIRAAEIQPGPNSSWGVRALKSYLAYLESGELPRPDFAERPPLPEFEQAVATALRRRGLDIISPLSPQ
ncbi:MAG: DEAD/DEAH box helicase, partial [Acidobacteriota bacterium]